MLLSKLQIASIGLVALATIFLAIGVGTNYWNQTIDGDKIVQTSIGLWKSCSYDEKGVPTCVDLATQKNSGDGIFMGWGDWLIILKTFAFISIFCGVIVLISFAVYEFCQKRGYRLIQTGLILMTATGFMGFGLFVVHMPISPPSLIRGYSMSLFASGSCLALVATCISLVEICLTEKDERRRARAVWSRNDNNKRRPQRGV